MQDSSEHCQGQRASGRQRPWPLLAFFLLLLVAVFIGLVAAGVVEVGVRSQPEAQVKPGGQAETPKHLQPPTSAESAAAYVERLPDVEKCFELAGFNVYAWRYSGGPVESWIEVETDGKTEVLASGGQEGLTADLAEPPFAPAGVHGYIIFMGPGGSDGRPFAEASKGKYYLLSEVSSGTVEDVGPPGVSGSMSRGRVIWTRFVFPPAGLPAQQEPATKPSRSEGVYFSRVMGRRLLQPDEEVCLYEEDYREQGDYVWRLKCKLLSPKAWRQESRPGSTSAPTTRPKHTAENP